MINWVLVDGQAGPCMGRCMGCCMGEGGGGSGDPIPHSYMIGE